MQPIPLPAPWGGVNDQIPVQALQQPNCENLLNFNTNTEGVVLRSGDSKYNVLGSGAANRYDRGDFVQSSGKLFYAVAHNSTLKIFDVEANSLVYTSGALGTTVPVVTSTFNKYLYAFIGLNVGYSADIATYTWGVSGYTGTSLKPIGGASYKNRHYLVQYGEAAYWYSGIDAIAGAVTKVDLSSLLQDAYSDLYTIAPFTLSDTVQSVDVLAFYFQSGEIFFYTGTYPNSESWTLIGKAKIGPALSYDAGVKFQGDYLIFCESGIVSLRDLFLKGSQQALNLSVNSKIQDHWKVLVKKYKIENGSTLTDGISGTWDQVTNRIIITFPGYLDSNGDFQFGSFYFVFDTLRGSWSFHRTFLGVTDYFIGNSCFYKGKVLTSCSFVDGADGVMIYEKEGSTGFMDRKADDSGDIAYDYEIISAPIANGRAYVQKGEGMDVIVSADLHAETNYYLIKDFGVQITIAQKAGVTLSGGPEKPFINMGIEGTYIQYKISGTTSASKVLGYKLFGLNFWVEMGESPR